MAHTIAYVAIIADSGAFRIQAEVSLLSGDESRRRYYVAVKFETSLTHYFINASIGLPFGTPAYSPSYYL